MKLAGLYGYMTIHSGVKTCSLLSFSSSWRNSTSTSEKVLFKSRHSYDHSTSNFEHFDWSGKLFQFY